MSAPKGNKYAKGNKGGQKPFYETPEKLQNKADEYFNQCLSDDRPVTISGLCYHLGFESLQSFYDYEKRQEFSYAIKKLRLFVVSVYEELLSKGNSTGAIFALKNFGWKDKQEIEVTSDPLGRFFESVNNDIANSKKQTK